MPPNILHKFRDFFLFHFSQRYAEDRGICLSNYRTCMAWNRCAHSTKYELNQHQMTLVVCTQSTANAMTENEKTLWIHTVRASCRLALAKNIHEKERKKKPKLTSRTTRQFWLDDFSHHFYFSFATSNIHVIHEAWILDFWRGQFLVKTTNRLTAKLQIMRIRVCRANMALHTLRNKYRFSCWFFLSLVSQHS